MAAVGVQHRAEIFSRFAGGGARATQTSMNVVAVNPSPPLQKPAALRVISVLGVLLFSLGAVLPLFLFGHAWIVAVRWVGLLAIASTGLWRQSLTRWIFFAMLLGGEIGLDRPQFAEHLRVLSEIFLRLIKVIVAPLIFGTLVTGISGHGNLRSVGRIGLKSLIYFEVVTTLALLLGVAAINLSRAGEGRCHFAAGRRIPAADRCSASLG